MRTYMNSTRNVDKRNRHKHPASVKLIPLRIKKNTDKKTQKT